MLLPAIVRRRRSQALPIVAASAAACVISAIGLIGAMVARAPVSPPATPAAVAPPATIFIPTAHFALPPPPAQLPEHPPPVWASSVRGFSSQYEIDVWSAKQALGEPDVYPESGDLEHAWASETEDGRTEYLDLGFAPTRMSSILVYETYNPGAVTRVTLTFADGTTQRIDQVARGGTGADSVARRIDLACTAKPVVGVKLTLDSKHVAGWNEIDAVGAVPCR